MEISKHFSIIRSIAHSLKLSPILRHLNAIQAHVKDLEQDVSDVVKANKAIASDRDNILAIADLDREAYRAEIARLERENEALRGNFNAALDTCCLIESKVEELEKELRDSTGRDNVHIIAVNDLHYQLFKQQSETISSQAKRVAELEKELAHKEKLYDGMRGIAGRSAQHVRELKDKYAKQGKQYEEFADEIKTQLNMERHHTTLAQGIQSVLVESGWED